MRTDKGYTFIKIGGAIVTDKNKAFTLRQDALDAITDVLAGFVKEQPAIIGHGQGSFGHSVLKEYDLMDGEFEGERKVEGLAKLLDCVTYLNHVVEKGFLDRGVNAATARLHYLTYFDEAGARHDNFEWIDALLDQKLVPITCGDVILHEPLGWEIFSTEKVFEELIEYFLKTERRIDRVIHITEVEGFLDAQHSIIPEITSRTWRDYASALFATNGFDGTGGMKLKVESALVLAEKKIETVIISGNDTENLKKCLAGEDFKGTKIYHE